jgi:hypothetical protein
MADPADFLKLSLSVQVALGSGYVAYLISYAGIRQHHSPTDIVFRTLAFGLIASATLAWTWFIPPVQVALAVVCTIAAGALWRGFGRAVSSQVLKRTDVSWSDDIPTAWLSISAVRTDCRPSQIAVELLDGRLLLCADTRDFSDAPYGPCVLGLSRDIALYVTDEMRPNGEWLQSERVQDPIDGANLTYVPASQIRRVELRHWTKKLNDSVAGAVMPAQDEAAEAVAS